MAAGAKAKLAKFPLPTTPMGRSINTVWPRCPCETEPTENILEREQQLLGKSIQKDSDGSFSRWISGSLELFDCLAEWSAIRSSAGALRVPGVPGEGRVTPQTCHQFTAGSSMSKDKHRQSFTLTI